MELVERVRAAVGADFPLIIKFGIQDDKAGLTLAEGMETARLLLRKGIDAIEVSVGVGTSMRVRKGGEPDARVESPHYPSPDFTARPARFRFLAASCSAKKADRTRATPRTNSMGDR